MQKYSYDRGSNFLKLLLYVIILYVLDLFEL